MGEILITFVKQSSAYKLVKVARRNRINIKIVQTPKELSAGGCSYGVVARRGELSRLVSLCREYSIEYRKIFSIYSDTNGEKVYSEI